MEVSDFVSKPPRSLCFFKVIAALFFFASALSGCFHYTPSREELASSGDEQVAGPEAFEAYQSKLKERLSSLVAERASLLESRGEQAYRVGVGDVLRVDVFGFSDLGGESTADEKGCISLPLVGVVPVAGNDVSRLQEELAKQFFRFVKHPKIRVTVSQYNSQRVSVVGSVTKPGIFPLKHSGYLLTELLAEVGGVKDNAGSRVYLIPASFGEKSGTAGGAALSKPAREGIEIDMEELVGTLDKPPLLIPLTDGDTVIVPEAGQFRVDGEVERPGSFPVTRRTSALGAVAAAGGFTYAANVNQVEVIRDFGAGKKASMTVDLEKVAFRGSTDIGLRDGDVVIVPSAPGRFRARQIVEAFRSVFRGGVTGSVRYQ